jgi:hypothetical protein
VGIRGATPRPTRQKHRSTSMLETEFAAEAVGSTKGFGGERGEVIDVLRLACAEQRLKQRVGQDTRIEGVLETVNSLYPAPVFEHRYVVVHRHILPVKLIERPIGANRAGGYGARLVGAKGFGRSVLRACV